jgi:nicotinate dehydrogenase subunit A
MSAITLKVNGQSHTLDLDPATPLLYALSDDLALRGPKFGCGLGQCGACTVIVKGQAVRSCVTPVKAVAESEITTLEGLGTVDKLHPIQKAFLDERAAQCGFCLNGIILTAKALLDKNPKASEQEIQQAMSGVLCRCFTNVRMLRILPPRFPQDLGRAHRQLQRIQHLASGTRRRTVGRFAIAQSGGLLDCHRRRRQRHSIQR